MNNFVGIGRLTKEPEYKILQDGKGMAKFTLAIDRYNKDEADFLPIVVWGKTAENCGKYLDKGSLVAVHGRVQVRSWEKDGKRYYATEIVANTVKFLDTKKKSSLGTEVENDDDIPF